MKRNYLLPAFVFALFCTHAALAQAPAGAPAGATGMCKDGTYYTGPTKSGACSGHKGVKDWYGSTSAKSAPAPKPSAATPAPPPPMTPKPAPALAPKPTPAPPMAPTATKTSPATKPAMAQASGGGPGMVWVNTDSKVYHCSGTRWYGKTKQGKYMSEADAKSMGAKPDAGKPCPK